MRPLRTTLNENSMVRVIGIPKKFINRTTEDLYSDSSGRKSLKKFVVDYINNIEDNFKNSRGIYLYGSNGVGKTLISSILLKEAYRHRYSCKRVTFQEYINSYTKVWNANSIEDREELETNLYTDFKGVEFLVLEEIGKGVETSIEVPILEDLLRYREDKGLVTIFATNISPSTVKDTYGVSIFSLITGNCIPVQIEGEDLRKKRMKK